MAWFARTAAATLLAAALAASPAHAQSDRIAAVVNGDVISEGDVAARARLFALSSGIALAPDVVERLHGQVTRQLVDERLRLQEVQRRHVVITDKQIADAIREIEGSRNLPTDTLRHRLEADGVGFRTLVDEIRVQLGWLQVLREQLGDSATVTKAEIEEQQRLLQSQTGKTEYRVSEIFVPIDNPSHAADAQRFADTIITQLRGGAPFNVVAAQFSQSQTALQGGDLGWVQANQLDPDVARVVAAMPEGAVSNPLRVPGGLSIVTLKAKREIGHDMATMLKVRQLFLPFSTPLNPQAPTEQQKQTLLKAKALSTSIHTCEQMEAANKANNSPRPADPGDVRLESVNPPQFRAILAGLQDGQVTPPLPTTEGIALLMVCSREQKNMASETSEDIQRRLLAERAELASRQLLRDLQRKAQIDLRTDRVANKS
jgi:peptidyl-prolyl cis-trans isomerase SurA